jgi:ADP-heptose:LPS heptosyltransferase
MMAAVIECTDCFIGFNSGPAHVAAGTNTPGVVFYRPDENTDNEIRKWKPLSDRLVPLVPPSSSSEPEWSEFLDKTRQLLLRTVESKDTRGEV